MKKSRIRDREKHLGSATLTMTVERLWKCGKRAAKSVFSFALTMLKIGTPTSLYLLVFYPESHFIWNSSRLMIVFFFCSRKVIYWLYNTYRTIYIVPNPQTSWSSICHFFCWLGELFLFYIQMDSNMSLLVPCFCSIFRWILICPSLPQSPDLLVFPATYPPPPTHRLWDLTCT